MTGKTYLLLIIAISSLMLILAGCGDDDDDDSGSGPGQTDDDDTTDDDDAVDDDDSIDDDDIADDDDAVDDDDAADDDDAVDDDDASDDDDAVDDDDFTDPVNRLYAGASRKIMDVPVGVTMGGFGARVGPITQYSKLMGGSAGYHEHPDVRVTVLHNGDTRIVFARGTFGWGAESLRTDVVNQVFQRTGVDLDQTLILNGTHTHSGPGRYYVVPDYLGMIGTDVYNQEITDRLVDSFADAIIDAFRNEEPAKVGLGYREPFDPNQIVAADRRCENGPGNFKEDRLWTLFVESDAGQTLSVVIGMAVHGTKFDENYMTHDAPGGPEQGVELLYDYPVVAMYMQGSSGDVSPRGDAMGHNKEQSIPFLGWKVAEIVSEIEPTVTFDDQPVLKAITRRYTHDRQTLGYQPGEFGYYNAQGDFVEYQNGAMMCSTFPRESEGSIVDCDEPSTTLVDGYLGCPVNLDWPIFGESMNYLTQSPLTVAQIGDEYFFTTPGELTAHLSVDIREAMATELGVDFSQINAIGYAQNYIFYLTQDWDWMQGGFEVEGSLFGWRMGRWLTEQLPYMASFLPSAQPPTLPDLAPNAYFRDDEPVEPEMSENLGDFEAQPNANYTIFDTIHIEWHGGHPGIDKFTVTPQRLEAKGWVDTVKRNGAPYDDKGSEMFVFLEPTPKYLGNMHLASRDFLYLLDWETSWGDPTGTMRFKIEGKHLGANGPEAYTIYTETFELAPYEDVTVSNLAAEVDAGDLVISAEAFYPANSSGWRMRSPYAGSDSPQPAYVGTITATVAVTGFGTTTCQLTFDKEQEMYIGAMTIDHAGVQHLITIDAGGFDDGWGSTNDTATAPVTVTP